MSDKFHVTIECPRCGNKMKIHKARMYNWIHRCNKCREHFMMGDIVVDE